jgi:ABC-2 type transport system ATP-binding protein
MIEARSLTKRYGDKLAVDNLTFTVRPGAVTGFLGPNGAGKSTTMRMILGLDAPTSGTVTVNGKPYAEHARPLHEVGALLEARAVHTGRSARNHLLAMAATAGIGRRRVEEVIDMVGLADVAGKRVGLLLARDGPAARDRLGAAGRPGDADPRRAGQRARPGRCPLDPQPAARAGRRGPHGVPVLAPDERDGVDGRPRDRGGTRAGCCASSPWPSSSRTRRPTWSGSARRRPTRLAALLGGEGVTVRSVAEDVLEVEGLPSEQIGIRAADARITLYELSVQGASLEEAYMALTRDAVDYRSSVGSAHDELAQAVAA